MWLSIVGIIGGLGGVTSLLYGWTATVYRYNRKAWMNDVQVRQAHENQYDNMQIATHDMSREEIRDRMQAAMTRVGNYVLVTTLLLTLAAEILVENEVPKDCSDFVLNIFMLCLGSTYLYLCLSILFGVAASNVIYDTSAHLLTDKVPPPWTKIDKNMKDRRPHELTEAFESRPWKEIFTPPLFRSPAVANTATRLCTACTFGRWKPRRPSDGCSPGQQAPAKAAQVAELSLGSEMSDKTESMMAHPPGRLEIVRRDYEDWWKQYERMWVPLLSKSGGCAAIGVKNLLEVYGYLCMATLYGASGSQAWAFWATQLVFTGLNTLVMQFMFNFEGFWHAALVAVGPLSCAVAATTSWSLLDRVLIPLCYLSHCLQAFLIRDWDIPEERSASFGHQTGAMPTYERFVQSCPDVEMNVHSVDELIRQAIPGQGSLCAMPSVESEHDVLSYCGSEPPASIPPTPVRLREESEESVLACEARAQKVVDLMTRIMFYSRTVANCLWLFSVAWAIHKAALGGGFKNYAAFIKEAPATGPPVVGVSAVMTSWPSPYFKPHAIVCPRTRVFLADSFRVFELTDNKGVVPYPCDVDFRILDVAANCDVSSCWPVVLLEQVPLAIFDCSTGLRQELLQARAPASQIALDNNTLFVAHHGQVIQYQWSSKRGGWAPWWTVASVGKDDIDAMSIVQSRLLVFTLGVLVVYDLRSGSRCNVWELPPEVLGAGCTMEGGDFVLLLARPEPEAPGDSVRLLCAELRGQQGCPAVDSGSSIDGYRSSEGKAG